jgi:hypothetical protein
MSDHVDGPRSIGDPAADLSDLFAFTNPKNAARTVLGANVFPSAGAGASFSNAIVHSIVVRHVAITGTGNDAAFKAGDEEYRFSFRFDVLKPQPNGKPLQNGSCTLPGGKVLPITVDDERGAATPDGAVRVFAGLRSDPFILAWLLGKLQPAPNLLQHDNVLSIVVEFDTNRVLDLSKGSLFGAVAETVPIPQTTGLGALIGGNAARIDWVGRPEQTNMRLDNGALVGANDLRDLWNQQIPFSIVAELQPLFRQRLLDSLTSWDMRDGKADWTPAALAASANVFLDDFMVLDVTKPIGDASFLEIEKSTLNGRAYQTGGGRTVDSNVIDILLNWTVNRDLGPKLQGAATVATQPGRTSFPFLAPPNAQLQTVVQSVVVPATPDKVWSLIGEFGGIGRWHPLVAQVEMTGAGPGQLRTTETIDGQRIVERLESNDPAQRMYRYEMVSGIPASRYTGWLETSAKGTGALIEWRVQYIADGQPTIIVKTIIETLLKTGLASLSKKFGAPQ